MKKVYFCKKNDFETKPLFKALKLLFPDKKIKRKGCLGKCKTCKHHPFVVVDGVNISAAKEEKLYTQLFKQLGEEA
ncbi:DUF1450 domain-containing protein [Anaerobacillus sp. MEB173]|uniref:DUF1450 domain-containing protein n=1 Tax=Anaerobacillus sp. MEB173 TaxID=3383345 RepID=UPI003F92DECD